MAWSIPRLSRRAFLKTTGLGAAGLTLLSPATQLVKDAAAEEEEAKEEIYYSICNFCSSLCNLRVTTRTHKGKKRVVKLDGNPYSTLNRGKICARGQAGLRQTYDTDRIKTPMIRVKGRKRGDYAFRPASWEEAYDYIAKKVQAARIKPWEWTMVGGWTSCVFYMNWAVPFAMANEIPNIVASPMQHCVTTGHLGTDMVTGNFNIHDEVLPDFDNAKYILLVANNASIGAVSTCRMVRFAQGRKKGAKIVALDPRRSETAAKADEWIPIKPGTDLAFLLAMMRILMSDGLYDGDFLCRHTNMPFLAYRDEAGELRLLSDAEGRPQVLVEGAAQVRVLPKFTNDNQRDIEGHTFTPALTTPKGFSLDGRAVMTVFEAQLQELAPYTPEWAAEITGIPAQDIRRIAYEFGTTRPAIIDPGWHGARFGNVMMLRRVQAMIQALTGGIDRVGGWINSGEVHHKAAHMYEAMEHGYEMGSPLASLAGMAFAKMVINALSKGENFSHGRPGWTWAWNAQEQAAGRFNVALPVMTDSGLKESVEGRVKFKGEPYLTRAFLINASNPVRHYYPDTRWKETLAHENVELVVLIDVLPSDTALYADVILPNTTYLERDEPTLYGNGVNHDLALTTRYAAIPPLYDTEEAADILLKMTEIISGNTDTFHDWVEKLTGLRAEPIKAALARNRQKMKKGAYQQACREVAFAQTADRLGVTPQHIDEVLRAKGVYHEMDRDTVLARYAMPAKLPVPTESGRIEFYSSLMCQLRDGGHTEPNFSVLATYIPVKLRSGSPQEVAAPLAKDEFYFTYGKTPTVSHGSTNSNNPVLAAINEFKTDVYKGVWIHPSRAQALGIRMGDRIQITNTQSGQQTTGHAYVTRLIHPDVLFVYSSFGVENKALSRTHGEGTATSKLIPYQVEPVVAGFRSQEFTVRVTRL
ncbi:molybdopterin-dependent oxidoreductase [Caldichromatium japonicum]|uniref:Molybdopterin-dependent oxidoreductase n=1 Tax=Caldichromatium japonicum TaxID=2699430 RepID=A0A6G7VEA9_9GAMM|nr:molybdopterin-dependent oxidoreductase [Caldichromatium japonicum]QIK38225.1 molybdopterin-dependent oxidoreductase [Caldichromatium japonicum]